MNPLKSILWSDIWNDKQIYLFTKKHFWLSGREGKLGCNACADAKTLLLSKEVSRLALEWINFEVDTFGSSRENKLSSLRTKMKRHNDSSSHKLAETFQKKAGKNN